jgi:hypothetical protein
LGAESEQVQLIVADGRVSRQNLVVHFPIPMMRAWDKVLELAQRWYGGHLRADWTKKSVAEARAIFAELGLAHPVWSLPSHDGRF